MQTHKNKARKHKEGDQKYFNATDNGWHEDDCTCECVPRKTDETDETDDDDGTSFGPKKVRERNSTWKLFVVKKRSERREERGR